MYKQSGVSRFTKEVAIRFDPVAADEATRRLIYLCIPVSVRLDSRSNSTASLNSKSSSMHATWPRLLLEQLSTPYTRPVPSERQVLFHNLPGITHLW